MERVFVDTNIVIDLLQKRPNFYEESQELFTLADKKELKICISSLSFATTYYLLSKHYNSNDARKIMATFKVLVDVLAVDDKIIELALASDFKDFEDGIQYFTAIENSMSKIITRNKKDFKNSVLPVLTANEFLKI